MSPSQPNKVSFSEYKKIRDESDERLEYLDGFVFSLPSPSTKHQRISAKMTVALYQHLEGTDCEVFNAPYDIELKDGHVEGTHIVIPDLSVICEKDIGENRFTGVPLFIVEILSPSNQSHDLVTKLNLYMQYGVKEYWIINPMLNVVQIYTLDDERQYQQANIAKDEGMIESTVLEGFRISLERIF
ncbi:Uma2 family endonuclease [Halobacillus litoralis]|uniref:Uma2 family endonuclease n=1 Tax=Halobacillus litoralis TaxID=45668 RepID=UPI001CD33025|nr:Uma2 family endonuclease [Halobacillus litoralis]MCA0970788.1 Uma2 family endonuclease [Halobacillus litoralis]